MADRFVLKQFAGSATNNGAFGAAQATGAGVQFVTNIKDVQSLNAFEQGWDSATLTADKLPALEEMQGLEALLCKAIKENYSEGIPFWISGETYYQHSFVNYNGVIYYNTTGSYTANNPAIDTANWSEYKPSAAGVADKLGTATVGNETIPIYLDDGTATPCKQTAITVYANEKTYSLNEVVMTLDTNNNVKLYKSLANNNTSALSDDTKWEEVSLGGGGGGGEYFGKSMYSDIAPNNASWLASNGQWNARAVYPDYYDWLVGQMNAGVSGFVASTATYTDYDFVVNTADQTFRLPLLNGSEYLPSDRKTPLTLGASGSREIAPANGFYCLHASNNTNGLEIYVGTSTNFTLHSTTQDAVGFNGVFAPVKRGDTIEYYYSGTGTPDVFQFIYAKGNGSLYYYVGDTVQDASLINAGAVLSEIADLKANTVTTDTAQTITGSKRFAQPSAGMSIELTADTNQQTVPTASVFRQLGLYKNNTHTKGDGFTSWIHAARGSDGWTGTELYTRRFLESDSQEIINYLKVNVSPDGIPVAYTRTPPTDCAGEEIVTAGWINAKMQVVSALPANPDPNVFYFIPE